MFVLSGCGISSCKMTLKDETSPSQSLFGSGSGHDMVMNGTTVYINPGHSFAAGHLLVGTIMTSKKWKSFLWPDRLLR